MEPRIGPPALFLLNHSPVFGDWHHYMARQVRMIRNAF
jgi:hypothetical protein